MSGVPSRRHARLIARTELRRKWRSIAGNAWWRLGVFAVAGLFGLLPIAGVVFGAYVLGDGLRAGTIDAPMALLRVGAAGAAMFVAFLTATRTVQVSGEIDGAEGLLTTVPHRDVVAGLLLAEGTLFLGVAVLPILATGVAFALGAASPLGFVSIILALLTLVTLGIVIGYPIGLVLKLAFARSQLLARYKTTVGALVMLLYFGAVFTNSLNAAFGPLLDILKLSPLGWLADLALVGAPGAGVALARAVGAVGAFVLGVPLLVGASITLAERLWYGDPVQVVDGEGKSSGLRSLIPETESDSTQPGHSETVATERSSTTEKLFGGFVSRPALQVAQKDWRRARRAPLKLWYAAYPLFLLGFQIGPILDSGQVPGWVVLYIAIVGAWATGAAFALNPLGDEGAVLPATLTASVSGRQFVDGTVLAGVAVGVPLTIVATLALGAISSLSILETLGVAAVGAILCIGATALAAGIGTAYPKFEQSRITRSRKAVVPSLSAFAVYTLALGLLGIPGVVSQFPSLLSGLAVLGAFLFELVGAPPSIVQIPSALGDLAVLIESTPSASLAGIVLTALLAVGISWISYRYAGRTFNEYTL